MQSETRQLVRKCVDISLGPLRWHSTSERLYSDQDRDENMTLHTFADQLQALIALALREGCSRQDINTLLEQTLTGDHHGDA